MTAQTLTSAAQIVSDVAESAAPALAAGSELTIGEVQLTPVELDLDQAVLCKLGGSVEGELALFVESSFAESLARSDVGDLDLAAALGPALAAVTARLGSVIVGAPTTVDARLALRNINSSDEMAVVGLDDGSTVRAAVAVGLASVTTPARPAAPAAGRQSERLDLLRGVEMAATVELGRTRMTINDLLSLRDGAVIELDRAAGEAADLFVNGSLIARGEIVVVNENYGLRVVSIMDDELGR